MASKSPLVKVLVEMGGHPHHCFGQDNPDEASEVTAYCLKEDPLLVTPRLNGPVVPLSVGRCAGGTGGPPRVGAPPSHASQQAWSRL